MLPRPVIWLRRFRHRCGYGVHSPFAFDFITNVVYERTPYYGYTEIEATQAHEATLEKCHLRRKTNRLLLRIVNRFQPRRVFTSYASAASLLYLRRGCTRARHQQITTPEEVQAMPAASIDFWFMAYAGNADTTRNLTTEALPRVHTGSVLVIEGICYTPAMRQLWKDIKADTRVVVTFDMYDVGIVLFDTSKNKQDYVVNF